METGKQPENKIQRKYKKYGHKNMEKSYIKEGKYTGRIKNWMEPGNQNQIKLMKKDVELRIEWRRRRRHKSANTEKMWKTEAKY